MSPLGPEQNADPKYQRIYEHFRDQIVAGKLLPGAALPTHMEIRDQFLAGPMTVQRALTRLANDGFTTARRGAGTRVSDHPPHLCRYALVFPSLPASSQHLSRFYQVLSDEAARLDPQGARRVICFWGVDGHIDSEDQQRLEYEVRSRRLAGVIFASNPIALTGSAILSEPGTPRIALMSGSSRSDVATLQLDNMALIDKSIEYLRSQGRRRVALLMPPDHTWSSPFVVRLMETIAQAGMETRPYWIGRVSLQTPVGAHDYIHLLFQPHQKDRPDALFITDDNLTEPALAGLAAAGMTMPMPLTVVTHCNFPDPISQVLPAYRVGYDMRQVLWHCIARLDEIARTGTGGGTQVLGPVTETEMAQGALAPAGLVQARWAEAVTA
jgi:DNA-binding LacI/PurR family transcriptional regulator